MSLRLLPKTGWEMVGKFANSRSCYSVLSHAHLSCGSSRVISLLQFTLLVETTRYLDGRANSTVNKKELKKREFNLTDHCASNLTEKDSEQGTCSVTARSRTMFPRSRACLYGQVIAAAIRSLQDLISGS